jgi:hypothetical protein
MAKQTKEEIIEKISEGDLDLEDVDDEECDEDDIAEIKKALEELG